MWTAPKNAFGKRTPEHLNIGVVRFEWSRGSHIFFIKCTNLFLNVIYFHMNFYVQVMSLILTLFLLAVRQSRTLWRKLMVVLIWILMFFSLHLSVQLHQSYEDGWSSSVETFPANFSLSLSFTYLLVSARLHGCFGWNAAWLTRQCCLLRHESIRSHKRLLAGGLVFCCFRTVSSILHRLSWCMMGHHR